MAASSSAWSTDTELGSGFVQQTLRLGSDDDGPVTATLVRNAQPVVARRGAILYLHGFIDYFFQTHVADFFNAAGYDFYALDLRKYGRSLSREHPNFCRDFTEYFPEITTALDILRSEGHAAAVLMAHSTGALSAALYAREGERRSAIRGLVLNSPFLALPQGALAATAGAIVGTFFPFARTGNRINPWYVKSLHADYLGEWRFNTALKPLAGFDVFFGWLRAVARAQGRVRSGLGLDLPVLALHSDRSAGSASWPASGPAWSDAFHRADLVLDVADIARLAPKLGPRVKLHAIRGGKHDLTLSEPDARQETLRVMLDWIEALAARPVIVPQPDDAPQPVLPG